MKLTRKEKQIIRRAFKIADAIIEALNKKDE